MCADPDIVPNSDGLLDMIQRGHGFPRLIKMMGRGYDDRVGANHHAVSHFDSSSSIKHSSCIDGKVIAGLNTICMG